MLSHSPTRVIILFVLESPLFTYVYLLQALAYIKYNVFLFYSVHLVEMANYYRQASIKMYAITPPILYGNCSLL